MNDKNVITSKDIKNPETIKEKNEFEGEQLIEYSKHFGKFYTSFIKDNEEILRFTSLKNSINIIKTDNKMKSFVKYVNHKSHGRKRYFLELKFIY